MINGSNENNTLISELLVRDYINKGINELNLKLNKEKRKMLYDFRLSGLIDGINTYIKNSCLIACFSIKIDSMLMWSHYADSHKGFCIVYDISKVDASHMIRKNLYPVIYKNEKFDISCYLDDSLQPRYPCIASLCWKNDIWSYEKECRIVIPCENINNHSMSIKFIKPVAICLGANMDKKDEDIIENIALDRGIKVFNMICDEKKYVLKLSELIFKRRESN